jgi:hypothetical protein
MTSTIFVMLVLGAVFAAYLVVALRAYFRYRGARVVTCPETKRAAGVEVNGWHAAITALWDRPDLRLQSCSRWPERQNCGQECLAEIQAAPEGCLVRSLVAQWYAARKCAICHQPIESPHALGQKPGLLGPDHQPVAWESVPAADLPRVLETHRPLCANCLVIESFRREFPDLGIERPARDAAGALHLKDR